MDSIRRTQCSFAQFVTFAALAALAAIPAAVRASPPTTESVILFNTVCAQCHEMECSRRLSFSSDAPAGNAGDHIRNYAGPLETTRIEELFALIEYTKTNCDYYAPPVPIPQDGLWSAKDLAPLATSTRTGWFVPLGALAKKTWVLNLAFESDQAVTIEVVNRKGLVAQEQAEPGAHGARLVLDVVDGGIPHFLRLRGRSPISFARAALVDAGIDEAGR